MTKAPFYMGPFFVFSKPWSLARACFFINRGTNSTPKIEIFGRGGESLTLDRDPNVCIYMLDLYCHRL